MGIVILLAALMWGFSSDQFNHFDSGKGNKVQLVNAVDTIDCPVIRYLTNENKIVCTVGPRTNTNGPEVYQIKVWSDGVEAAGYQDVRFIWWLAPKIQFVTPMFARTGSRVSYSGWFQTDKLDQINTEDTEESPTGSKRITKVYMGRVLCKMYESASNTTLYGTLTDRELTCQPETVYIGPMNASMYVTDAGPSVNDKWGLYVNSKDIMYQHHTYAVVESVSPSTSSSNGGALLTITGQGFAKNTTQVDVGGAACEVKDVTNTEITCITPSQDLTAPGSGEMGLLFELWRGEHFNDIENEAKWAALNSSHSSYEASVTFEMSHTVQIDSPSVGKYRGYLHVGHDGLYTLHPSHFDHHRLYVANDGNTDNMTYHSWDEKFTLYKDTPAYFEIRFRITGNLTFFLVLRDYNSKFTYSQARHGLNEKHRVTINPSEQSEKHRFTVTGPSTMAKIYINGFSSDLVNISDPEEVLGAVKGLTEQQCMLNGDDPKFMFTCSYERDETFPPGTAGTTREHVEPFCGRRVREARISDGQIYRDDAKGALDANEYPYVCFALKGDVDTEMKVRFFWKDSNKKDRYDTITFTHNKAYSSNRWTYACHNLITVAKNSWISDHGYTEGSTLDILRVYAPVQTDPLARVYIDEFTFSSEDITVVQMRPSALKSSSSILVSNVQVSVSADGSYTIKFYTGNCQSGFPLLGVYTGQANSSWPSALESATSETYDLGGGSEVTVTRTDTATGPVQGTWDLHIQDKVLQGIRPDIEGDKLAVMLNTLMGVNNGFRVSDRRGCDYFYWDIEWLTDPGRKELGTVDDTNLVFDGDSVTTSVSRIYEGQVYHYPITPDFVTAYTDQSKVVVRVNGYTAACEGQCDISFDDSNLPTLTSVNGNTGAEGLHTLTVTGSGFTATDTADYTVTVGGKDCTVTSVTATQVVCTVVLTAGSYQVGVSMQPYGSATTTLTYNVNLSVTSVSPTTGGTGGYYELTVAGQGFLDLADMTSQDEVTVGGAVCQVVASMYSEVKCIVPPGTSGTVSVSVEYNGKTATLSNAFTYDSSLSASLTSVSPTSLSALGGEELTITGSNFGSDVGSVTLEGETDVPCNVSSWSDTSITCTTPTLTPQAYTVWVSNDQGRASQPSGGAVTVTVVLKVTGTSTTQGSVKGGTLLALRGQGFGTDCSLLEVRLGSRGDMCQVQECTDTSLTCQVQLVSKNHIIHNTGADSAVGVSWQPSSVEVREGDTVTWVWQQGDNQITHNVFQSVSPTDNSFNGVGFYSGSPTPSGAFQVEFNHESTVYFAGDPTQGTTLSGQITVMRPGQEAYPIQVILGGIAATYEPDNIDATLSVSGCPTLVEGPLDGCNLTSPTTTPTGLSFTTHTCLTPSLTQITASATESLPGLRGIQVRGGATLTLTGSGFGDATCQHLVSVGGAGCSVTSATTDTVTCDLDDLANLVPSKPFPVRVVVLNRGEATVDITNYETDGQVVVVPVVTDFTPRQGSVAGGTTVTFTGTGLNSDNGVLVYMGSASCTVQSVTASSVTCVTSPLAESVVMATVSVAGVSAVMDMSDKNYNYTESATPTITSLSVSATTFTISGTNFGTDSSKVTITLVPSNAGKKRSLEEELEEEEEEMEVSVEEQDELFEDEDWFEHAQMAERMMSMRREESELMEETYGPHTIHERHIPKLQTRQHSHMSDDVVEFWGKLTGTEARSFHETRKLGVWRVGGSALRRKCIECIEEEEGEMVREKRQTNDNTVSCTVTSTTDSEIQCDAPEASAGSYTAVVNIEGSGNAAVVGSNQVTAVPVISNFSPTEGSTNGGSVITITGSAFDPSDVTVTIGSVSCDVMSATTTSITCQTMTHEAATLTVKVMSGGEEGTATNSYTYSVDKTPVLTSLSSTTVSYPSSLTVTGTNLMPSSADPQVLIDGLQCSVTSASATSVTCDVPDHVGGDHSIVVRDTTYGDSNSLTITYTFTLTSVSPSTGGFGGTSVTLSGEGFDPTGNSSVTFCGVPCSPITSSSSSQIQCTAPPTSPGGSNSQVCDVTVTNPDGSEATLSSGFTYDAALTPAVTSVTPTRGGTAGGTSITITGTGFADSGNTVTIGGSDCVVDSESSTSITCTTQPHQGPGQFPVQVNVPAKGFATTDENGEFFYIDRWSSVYTWGGEAVPSTGQLVVVDNGQTLLLDQSTDVLKMLLIKGGHVIFDRDATEEIILRAEYILIVEGGSLSIGSEEEPFLGQAVIELYGSHKSIELPYYGSKVLAVREGGLDLHGAHIPITWTHLATPASPGDTSITLKLPVTWKQGDEIVIATTEMRFMKNENEVRKIASVSSDGLTVTLTEELEYEHVSMEQTLGGRTIQTRAEVGLLTRNVKVRGAINADFTSTVEGCDETWKPGQFATQSCFDGRFGNEEGSDQFGATVMIFGKEPNQDLVYGRIEYVEVTEAGQAFQLGRYPLHFHLVGNVNTSYVRGCAVHRTYNRAVTIHAANYLTVERNVIYNNMGHAIFTEDGNEQHNVIQYNLAVYTRTSASLLNVDVTPSSYWLVNPNNVVQHNAAAGGTHFGYWYRLERHPTGPSATSSYCQNNEVMGTFNNNTAHSFGRYGMWGFSMDGYFPRKRTCSGPDLVAQWHGLTVWRCDRGAEIVFGGQLQFHDFVALDNLHAGLEMVKVSGNYGVDDGPGIFNSLVVGWSALTPEGCTDQTSGIVAPKQSIFSIANTTFVNYNTGMCTALSGCSQCKPRQGGFTVQVTGLTFDNSPNKLKFQWEYETVWIDTDGSLTGTPENTVVPSMDILPYSSGQCQRDVTQFSINPEAPGSVCSNLKFVRFNVEGPNIEPPSLQAKTLLVSNSEGSVEVPYKVKRLTDEGWMGLLYTDDTYILKFNDSEQITNITYEASFRFLEPGDHLYIQHELIQTPDGFSTLNSEVNGSDSLPDPTTGNHGDYFWDNNTNTMTYLVSEKTSGRRRRTVFDERNPGVKRNIFYKVYRCQYEGCIPPTVPPVPTGRPDNVYRWSDKETWKDVPVGSGGHPTEDEYDFPVEGDRIIIPQGMWLLVDIDTPSLERVYVYGTLEFEDTMDHVFNSTIIYIQGGSVIAGMTESDPFTHNLNIVLRGSLDSTDPDNEDFPMPSGVPNVGWKAIGVFGQLALHGQLTGRTWMKLASTATAGQSQVTLTEPVDPSWQDKEVMITTTSKETHETEIRVVTSVSGSTLTLDSPLNFDHIAETHTLHSGQVEVTLAGEVGLLTRNIVIEGNKYPGFENKLGGRVIVSRLTQDGLDYEGFAKLDAVEFRNMGQLGFDDTDDPRFSLAFHSLGEMTTNYVKRCSFNVNFSPALGFFSTDSVMVEANVFYHTVGSGVIDEGSDNVYKDNLLVSMLFPGTYNGAQEDQNMDWYGSFNLNKATNPVLENNVVAGSEQAGIRTYGENCQNASLWLNNEIHSAIFGVLVWKKSGDADSPCKRVSNMYAWRIEDTAFFMMYPASLLLSDVTSVDNKLGTNQLVYRPTALSHEFEDKTATVRGSVFVGATPSHTCDFHQSTSSSILFLKKEKFWEGGKEDGNTGILFASFMSNVNMAPKHKFNELSSYPALHGSSYIEDVTFINFDSRENCSIDVALMTNQENDDAIHPIFTSDLTFVDTPEDNYVFIHYANLARVNPSDCVDMDCDGHKKVVVTDDDGTLLGSAQATLTSEAENEWDGDRSHGVGDYRIPIPLRQRSDGSAIHEADKFPNKGIVRDNSCTKMATWQGWKCTNLRHRMMIIESLDSDTEVRRLSPIGLIANPGTNGYVDLVNGPMDRGWCFGYTCQERISTFYTVVASNTVYEVAMTSTPPQVIRLHLLHADPSEAVVLRIYFPKLQRYDIYVDDVYVAPKNLDTSKLPAYQLLGEDAMYEPTLSDATGSNYLQRSEKLLHVVLRGGQIVDIKTTPMVILTTGLVVDSNNFFEGDVVQKIALLLGVAPENIRVLNVITEGSTGRRTKRETQEIKIEMEIASSPTSSLSSNTSNAEGGNVLTREQLDQSMANVVEYFQTGDSDKFNVSLDLVQVNLVEAINPPEEPGAKATQEEGSVIIDGGDLYSQTQQKEQEVALNKSLEVIVYDTPSSSMVVVGVPSVVVTYTLFGTSPAITVLNDNGDAVESLGHVSDPWQFTATLMGGDPAATLMGTRTVAYQDGYANFTDLFLDLPGNDYSISFNVTHPDSAPPLTVTLPQTFRAEAKNVTLIINLMDGALFTNVPFTLSFLLIDADSMEPVDISPLTVILLEQEMTLSLELMNAGEAVLDGSTSLSLFCTSMIEFNVTDLTINLPGNTYSIRASVDIQPAGWNFMIDTHTFAVFLNGTDPTITKKYIVKLKGRKKKLENNINEVKRLFEEKLESQVSDSVTWTFGDYIRNKKVRLEVEGLPSDVDMAMSTFCQSVSSSKFSVCLGNCRRKSKFFWIKRVKPDGKGKLGQQCKYKK
ncbi:hypothetical protein Pcinc_015818 [Petrolisthes cinctipes]|uniref:G8 domain-containing protein n=1 Tax=Petrolisthes cinctipes TaxID=88211 RepID=A0AAE1FXI6_PETCI|nr:hypothetical protein Pcinc_015818 [Petrolisthes cinctipes]